MKLYVDMDGVLADFDKHHEDTFGVRPCKKSDNVDWKRVRQTPNFYYNIPPMEDMLQLWEYIERYAPTVLTGVPYSVEEAEQNKQGWVAKNLGKHVPVICCPSKDKSKHCQQGDILIDDWEKYRHLWVNKGGVWITHTSAESTIRELIDYGL